MVRIASTMIFSTLQRNEYPFVALSELAENPQYGYTAKSFEDGIDGLNPQLVRITDLQDDKIEWRSVPYCEPPNSVQYLLKPNDILFARTGATTGKTHLIKEVPSSAVFASYLIRIRPRDRIFAGYLYAFFQSDNYWSQIIDQKQGSAQPNVNGQKLASLFLPQIEPELQQAIFSFIQAVRKRQDGDLVDLPSLPEPLSEQRRIVAKIEQLAAKIEEARGLRDHASFNSEIMLNSSRSFVFLTLSGKYENYLLENLLQMTSGENITSRQMNHSLPYAVYGGGGFAGRYDKYLYEESKIAIGRVGARCGCVFVTEPKSWVTDNALVITSFSDRLDMKFLVQALTHLDLRQQANQAAQPVVNQKRINAQRIPLPPFDEQRRIVAYLDSLQAQVDRLKALQAQTAAELEALLPSILDKAFKGEL